MTELSFAKTFLATLSSRPTKLPADYARDLKTFEPKGPYTLPRLPPPHLPMSKRHKHSSSSAAPPGSEPAIKIHLRSLRSPPIDMTLANEALSTSILELKQKVAEQLGGGVGVERVKVLYKKKPCGDARTVREVLGGEAAGAREVEFGVMVVGGAGGETAGSAPAASEVAQGPSAGEEVLGGEEFWEDLTGFLLQRLKDEKMSREAVGVFRQAWRGREQGR